MIQRYRLFMLLLAVVLSGCLPKQQMTKRRPFPAPSESQTRQQLPRNATAEAYIQRYKAISIAEMKTYGIPASITLAQALLESGNGNSYLAREANNHFGIKCASGWEGKTVRRDDDHKNECFRAYSTPEESFRDHSEFLLRTRYAALFELDRNDYKGWARGLKKAGYATNPRYAELLISLIERYELYQYDAMETKSEKIHREEKVLTEIVDKMPEDKTAALAKPPVAMTIHEVKAGDTLYSIAKRYGLSIEDVKRLNNLASENLYVGQLLLVSK